MILLCLIVIVAGWLLSLPATAPKKPAAPQWRVTFRKTSTPALTIDAPSYELAIRQLMKQHVDYMAVKSVERVV